MLKKSWRALFCSQKNYILMENTCLEAAEDAGFSLQLLPSMEVLQNFASTVVKDKNFKVSTL